MKSTDETMKEKLPVIRINKKLNKYDDVVLAPEKVKQAKEDLAKYGMPGMPPTKS